MAYLNTVAQIYHQNYSPVFYIEVPMGNGRTLSQQAVSMSSEVEKIRNPSEESGGWK